MITQLKRYGNLDIYLRTYFISYLIDLFNPSFPVQTVDLSHLSVFISTQSRATSWHQITFGAIGPTLFYHSPCAFSKSALDVQIVGVACVTKL